MLLNIKLMKKDQILKETKGVFGHDREKPRFNNLTTFYLFINPLMYLHKLYDYRKNNKYCKDCPTKYDSASIFVQSGW